MWAEVKGQDSNCPGQARPSSSLMYPSPWNSSRFKSQKNSFTCFYPSSTFFLVALIILLGEAPSSREPGQVGKRKALLVITILPKGPTLHYIQNFFFRPWTTWVSLFLTPLLFIGCSVMASENSVVKCVPAKKLKFWLQTEVWEVFFFSECVIGKQKNIKLKI